VTVSVNTSGSQSCTISTEHDLATVATANVFQLVLDITAMLGGTTPDELEIRIYGKARSSDTERLMDYQVIFADQFLKIWRSQLVLSPHHMRCTLKQTQGTGRTIPWAIYQAQ
jgi:hypothetical protein